MAGLFSLKFFVTRALTFVAIIQLMACTSSFFHPDKTIYQTPDELGLAYDDIVLQAADGTKLSAWRLKATGQRNGVIYFLHGNAENISTHVDGIYWLPEQGYDVLMLDYRGFGRSDGTPSLPEIYQDIEAGFVWLTQHYPQNEKIFFMGQSIGASLGVYWAAYSPLAQARLASVVLDSPFSSYAGMVEDALQRNWVTRLFAKPVSWCFSRRYDADRAAAQLPQDWSYLFFASKDDRVIPVVQGESLYQALPDSKVRIATKGPHIATFNFPENRETLLKFLQQ